MRTRIASAISVAVVALVATAALFSGARGADATQGQPIIAGQENTATSATLIETDVIHCTGYNENDGLVACGLRGINARGLQQGVHAFGTTGVWGKGDQGDGVFGTSEEGNGVHAQQSNPLPALHGQNFGTGAGALGLSKRGDGVVGVSNAVGNSGVYALNNGGGFGLVGRTTSDAKPAVWGDNLGQHNGVQGTTGADFASGVYGENSGGGYGVAGRAHDGIGVLADSNNGIALEVKGKAKFSRSGTATVAGTLGSPLASVTVTAVALSGKSLVLVTPQKNVAGVWVQAAVPNVVGKQFTIFLNQNVMENYPVAWFVIEKP